MACLTLREYINTVKTLGLLREKEFLKICFKRKGITEYYFPSIKPLWDNTDVGLRELEKKGLLDLYVIFDCVLPGGMCVYLTERDFENIYLNVLETLRIFKESENNDFIHYTSKMENMKSKQQYKDFDDYLEKNRPRIQRKLERGANELKDKNNLSKKYSNKNIDDTDNVSLVCLSIFVISIVLILCISVLFLVRS